VTGVEGWVMSIKRELVLLNALQGTLAIKRDWVAVGHLQALIDHLADEYGALAPNESDETSEVVIH